MFHKILVAIDNSAFAQQVFEEAVSLAKATNAHLMLLHVLSPMDEGYPAPPVFPSADSVYPALHTDNLERQRYQWERFEQQGLGLLRSQWEIATDAGVITEFTQHIGNPSQVICDVALTWKADLIVIGRRGFSGFKELLLGSVSNYVMHHAPCSVLTVQPPVHHNSDVTQVNPSNGNKVSH